MAFPVAAAPRTSEPDLANIDAFLLSQMQTNRIPGLAVGLVHGDQIAHLRGFGVADASGRVFTQQTPFIIGSDSKSFTALAILQLMEAGKIGLIIQLTSTYPGFTSPIPPLRSKLPSVSS